jgi:hypothetical protein
MYLDKSLKGKSILTNVNIEGELYTNTDILNESSGNYDIGSTENKFRKLYVNELNISGANYVVPNASAPIDYNCSSANISITLDNTLLITQGSLSVVQNSFQKPLNNSGGNISIKIDNTLLITAGNLSAVQNSFQTPLCKTGERNLYYQLKVIHFLQL